MSGEEAESMDDLKYILGNMGLEILFSIEKGARSMETIQLFSGIPLSCIKGRIPVLTELKLIDKDIKGYLITEKGLRFRKEIDKKKS